MRFGPFALGGLALLPGCSTTAQAPQASPQIARGQAYYTTCQGCHGNAAEGLAGMKAPRLAGLPANYIAEQLNLYRSGLRGGPEDFQGVQMNGRAKALPGEEAVQDVAAYIAQLPAPAVAPVPARGTKTGADLYRGCVACHGEHAEGSIALGAPPLAGTDPDYLARQLRNFKAGIRGRVGDIRGQQMKASAAALADDRTMHAVAAYASTLKQPDDAP